ncbi:hypothetical protein N207_05250 [Helicobacter pylori UM114]|uniref:Uncharacterized protein n=1 Tax=Helicobacter pylori UM114 TaxID=1355531 RepID=T0GC11_HELPX|nr:hypothetical protein N207_05250 [Helicobacter pylori UM114]
MLHYLKSVKKRFLRQIIKELDFSQAVVLNPTQTPHKRNKKHQKAQKF